MATYDDFDGVWFTIQAIGMYQADVLADVSFLVIDNHPEGAAGASLRALEDWLPHYRYIPFDGYRGTAVRDLVFREADADIVCCLDSHVLLRPGALAHLLDWFDAHPDSRDLLQGPLLYDSLEPSATHMKPTWGGGMFGQWDLDPRIHEPGCEPFEIPMHGLGLFACRRDAWPGLNPRLRGFGGEEGYLHEKFRQRGGRVLCHPQLGWLHRFSRPAGVSYPNNWQDRVRNYAIAWSEIGWDLAPVRSHFQELLGAGLDVDLALERAREQAGHPLNVFDGVFCLADGAGACDSHAHPPAIAWRTERLVPGGELGREHRRLAGWRDAVSRAARRRYQQVLLLDAAEPAGSVTVPPLSEREWDVCLLPAGAAGESGGIPASGSDGGAALAGMTVAVHERAYERLLADLPEDEAGQAEFLTVWGSVRGYLARGIADGTFAAVQAGPAGPGADRPRLAAGTEAVAAPHGVTVRQEQPSRVLPLNNTAAIVLPLCDGQHTVTEIAQALAVAFALPAPPLTEAAACVAELRRTGILAAPGRAGRPVRVLAFTCSRDRPVLLRHCILQMRAQTYPVDHSVYLNGAADHRPLYDDLVGDHLFLQFGPALTQHGNYLAAMNAVRLADYDLFCKIDDDDVYRVNYIEGVVADFLQHRWDYSGSHSDGCIRGTQWLGDENCAGLGPQSDIDRELGAIYIMPPTAAFSRRAVECIRALDLTSPPAGAQPAAANEDAVWSRAIARAGLVTRVRGSSRFTYNVHGGNVSTAGWLNADGQ